MGRNPPPATPQPQTVATDLQRVLQRVLLKLIGHCPTCNRPIKPTALRRIPLQM